MNTFKVKILNVLSPDCISVRLNGLEKTAFEMQEAIAKYEVDEGFKPLPHSLLKRNQSCMVLIKMNWYRGLILEVLEKDLFKVYLLDIGELKNVNTDSLWELPSSFTKSSALSFFCHLQSLYPTDMKWSKTHNEEIDKILPEDRLVDLMRRGPPIKMSEGYHSLPVDFCWEEVSTPDPFQPAIKAEMRLSKYIAESFQLDTKSNSLNETIETDDNMSDFEENNFETDGKEFEKVKPLKDYSKFRWLDPEMPSTNKFSARGTYVDDEGQIYLHLNTQRHTVRMLRTLLNAKLSNSLPDKATNNMNPAQECSARWKDGNWYRARFLKYLDPQKEFSLVLLVDFGNLCSVKTKEEVRTAIYAHRIPIQCLRTVLSNIAPSNGSWSERSLNVLQEKINYAKVDYNEKIYVTMTEDQPYKLPLKVSICNKAEVELSELLLMALPDDLVKVDQLNLNQMSDLLSLKNERFSWSVVPSGFYSESNPYILLQKEEIQKVEQVKIPTVDYRLAGIKSGSLIKVQVADVQSHNQVYVHPLYGQCEYLDKLIYKHKEMERQLSEDCEIMPPVIQPKVGMAVAVMWEGDDDPGWHRAHIEECTDEAIYVHYVDYGTHDWISGNTKDIADKWCELPALALEVNLPVEALEDTDLVYGIMIENLLSWEKDLWLQVVDVKDGGRLFGHLVKRNGDVVYKSVAKEGLIKVS